MGTLLLALLLAPAARADAPADSQVTSSSAPSSPGTLSLSIFQGAAHPGGWDAAARSTATLMLPSAAEMARYDRMQVQLSLACPSSGCGPWDFFAYATVCPVAAGGKLCDTVFAQWVTPYGRPGTWLTDISAMLALLADGGAHTFSFWTPQAAVVSMQLTLIDSGDSLRPSRAFPLFRGDSMPINLAYNSQHGPVTLSLAERPSRADLYVLMVSQGQGGFQVPDCAEFCNLSHVFGINQDQISRDFSADLTPTGCQDQVPNGVVPDQAGSWRAGRAGWCPGWHVLPWVRDVSASMVAGDNLMTYAAFYQGMPYSPQPVAKPPPGSFAAQMQLSSYLVVWTDKSTPTPPLQPPTAPAVSQAASLGPLSVYQEASGAGTSSPGARSGGCQQLPPGVLPLTATAMACAHLIAS